MPEPMSSSIAAVYWRYHSRQFDVYDSLSDAVEDIEEMSDNGDLAYDDGEFGNYWRWDGTKWVRIEPNEVAPLVVSHRDHRKAEYQQFVAPSATHETVLTGPEGLITLLAIGNLEHCEAEAREYPGLPTTIKLREG